MTTAEKTEPTMRQQPLALGTSRIDPAPMQIAPRRRRVRKRRSGFSGRVEAFISRLSTRNNFWHRVCSLFWLPYAFRSGIRMKRVDKSTFTAVLPFRRFNKNWYNAMAGASLLANSEIAGGMYLFAAVGSDYTVVCKELTYKFLRPCLGPAIYKVKPLADVEALIETHEEFNIEIELDIFQQRLPVPGKKRRERETRVGKCNASFHVTPKIQHEAKEKRRAARMSDSAETAATPTETDTNT